MKVMFGGRLLQQTVGIPMGTNCAPLLVDLFLYSYKTDFIQGLLKKNEKKLARSFNFTFRYIDYVLSLNNSRFGDFVDRIYPIELRIKDIHGWHIGNVLLDMIQPTISLEMPVPSQGHYGFHSFLVID